MKIFLDFDGVLHPEPCFDSADHFCFLPRFENVLRDFVNVEIVISSTWRATRSLDDLQSIFSEDIRRRIIGRTPNWSEHPDILEVIGYQRHAEVEAWLRSTNQPWEKWIAVDDKAYLFRPFLPNLVKTDSLVGFDSCAELKLRNLLLSSK
ncbi:hypothetical protein H8K35_06485 [Undibacterium sp. LX40W]|uniref:Uncharacterized protein n=1 Tax=Undibacterium nitidum TaxID=2762298 RepID=A0A923HLF0_9BURK|nr:MULTISPECIES: HAD domain-containing protein [Undibacterium]MBC3879966.1 hypothetical protein [Undibacterium nitidum]MBC3891298.1 hypothetical protein [Undibacterium sp. LX40W]